MNFKIEYYTINIFSLNMSSLVKSDITIKFSNNFPKDKIYECIVDGKMRVLIFNSADELFEEKVETIALLNNSGMFKNRTVSMIFDKTSPFITVAKSLIQSTALGFYENDVHVERTITYQESKSDIGSNKCIEMTGNEHQHVRELKEVSMDPQVIFDEVINIIRTKNLKLPNFKRKEPFAVKRQINWLRSILSRNNKTLPDNIAKIIISHLSNIDLENLQH